MEHVVFYPGADGAAAFRRAPSLEEAVRLVEHLRNVEGIAELSVHALTEVPMEFKAYYKVEVPAGEAGTASTPAQGAAPALEQDPAAPGSAPEPAPAEAAGSDAPTADAEAAADASGALQPEQAPGELVGAEANGKGEATTLGFFAP